MSTSDEQTLLKEIKQLVAERDSINDRLRTSRRGGRLDGSRFPRGGFSGQIKKGLYNPEDEKPKINKAEHKDSTSKRPYEKISSSNFFRDEEESLQVEKRPKVECSIDMADRNRRLLSVGVFGHLTSARDQLKKEEQTQQAQLQKLQMQRVEEKLKLARKNLIELRKRALEEERSEDTRRAEAVQNELIAKETELLRVHLSKHYQNMKNFIVTKVQPLLFWLPAVMNERTVALRNDTISFINEKIQTIETLDFSVSPLNNTIERETQALQEVKTRDSEDLSPVLSDKKDVLQISNDNLAGEETGKSPAADENAAPNDSTGAVEGCNSEATEVSRTKNHRNNIFAGNEIPNSNQTSIQEGLNSEVKVENYYRLGDDPSKPGDELSSVFMAAAEKSMDVGNASKTLECTKFDYEGGKLSQNIGSQDTNSQTDMTAPTDDTDTQTTRTDKVVRKSPRLRAGGPRGNHSRNLSSLQEILPLTRDRVDEMTVSKLCYHLKEHGLPQNGRKGVLKERLLNHLGL